MRHIPVCTAMLALCEDRVSEKLKSGPVERPVSYTHLTLPTILLV